MEDKEVIRIKRKGQIGQINDQVNMMDLYTNFYHIFIDKLIKNT